MNPNQQVQNPIVIGNFVFGGIGDSKYLGIPNSLPRMVGFDLHSEPGLLKVQQKMKKLSSTTIDEFCKCAVNCSNGNKYWMSADSGKIWQQDASDNFALVYTVSPTSGEAKILGAAEYNGYIYFFTQNYVHRMSVIAADVNAAGGASAWSSNAAPNWQCMNLIQTIGGTGATAYTPQTSIAETATHLQQFLAIDPVLESVQINIPTVGTGNYTVTIHDSSNTVIGSVTIANGSLSTGLNTFTFSSALKLVETETYHAHVTSTVADGGVATSANNDLESAQMSFYTASSTDYHPTTDVNLVLYVGDNQFVHQIDNETWTRKAVDIYAPHVISALGKSNTDLLIGTTIPNVNKCSVFWWNTWSTSFSNEDPIEENGVNAFIEADNYILVQVGTAGSFYIVGDGLNEYYKRIPGVYSPTATAKMHHQSGAIFNGNPIFGMSNVAGNPCDQGLYTIAHYSQSYNLVLNLDFPISQVDGNGYNQIANIEIGAVLVSGLNVYASWKDSNSTPVYGVDGLDWDNKIAKPFLESRVITMGRMLTSYNQIGVNYESLPDGTSFVIKTEKEHEGFGSAQTLIVDDIHKRVYAEDLREEARNYRVRVECVTSDNDAPTIESIEVAYD